MFIHFFNQNCENAKFVIVVLVFVEHLGVLTISCLGLAADVQSANEEPASWLN